MDGMTPFDDRSKYAEEHTTTVNYVFDKIGLDLNKYRDGDGSRANTTAYWDQNGAGVAVDWSSMSTVDRNALRNLAAQPQYGITIKQGGAWFYYVFKN